MRQGTLTALIFLFVISVGAAAIILSRSIDDPRFFLVGKTVFPELIDKVNKVDELNLKSEKFILTIIREGKVWRVRESDNYLASPNKVSKAILGLAELKYFEPKTKQKDKYARLRLENPESPSSGSKSLKAKVSGVTVADIIVGREKLVLPGLTVGGVYFRIPGVKLSWLGQGNPEVGGEPKDWLDREIANVARERVRKVVLRQPSGEIIIIRKETKDAGKFTLKNMPKGTKIKYESDLEQIGGILDQLEMIDARRVENVDINWHGSIVAEVETFDGLRGKVETVLKKNVHWLRVSFEAVTRAALPEVKALSKRSLNATRMGYLCAQQGTRLLYLHL